MSVVQSWRSRVVETLQKLAVSDRWLGAVLLSGYDAFELVHAEDRRAVEHAFAHSLSRPGTRIRVEFRSRRKDGSYAHLEAVGVNWLPDPEVSAVVVTTRDVTNRTLYDSQTGLASRVPLLQQVKESCATRLSCWVVFRSLCRLPPDRIARISAQTP